VQSPIKLGISSCLLGNEVRYDGGHRLDRFLTDTLGQFASFVPVCPEVECGFSVPREPMRLVGQPQSPRLVTVRSQVDHTERMLQWARSRVMQLEQEGLCGFIFKSGSPSSGMERVKVYNEQGLPAKTGVGLFARAFMEHLPLLPVEDEGRLHDPKLRENFIESVFVMQRWREVLARGASLGMVVAFHTRHKLLMLSHSPRHYQAMGKLVAQGKTLPAEDLLGGYQRLLMEGLRLKTTIKKHANVLQHLQGYFKKQLSADEKQELVEIIDAYRSGHVPLIVPITLINHYVRKHDQPYLKEQFYLHPHPLELQLRNHA
jgi:uncharacterized protein YbgA (DUF1722 family)/uncharacterized protein YbbK (DUF523 family)